MRATPISDNKEVSSRKQLRSVVVDPRPGPDEIKQALKMDRDRRERLRDSRHRDVFDTDRRALPTCADDFNRGFPRVDVHSRDYASDEEDRNSIATIRGEMNYGNSRHSMRSGLVRRAPDRVLDPQLWPHTALQGEFYGQNIAFGDLNFRLLVAGELEIVTNTRIDEVERDGRLQFLKQLAYLESAYSLDTIKSIYTAIVSKIEMRLLSWDQWDSEFFKEMQWILARQPSQVSTSKTTSSNVSNSSGNSSRYKTQRQYRFKPLDPAGTYFCRDYQANVCTSKDTHEAAVRGQVIKVQHFCAKCWQLERVKREHGERSTSCPNYEH